MSLSSESMNWNLISTRFYRGNSRSRASTTIHLHSKRNIILMLRIASLQPAVLEERGRNTDFDA